MGILRSQYKDPYKPTSIMESRKVFFVAQLFAPILGGMMIQVDYRTLDLYSAYFSFTGWKLNHPLCLDIQPLRR